MEKTQELWKTVMSTENRVYMISSNGRVLSRKKRSAKQRLLTTNQDKDGYMVTTLGGKQYKVHRLVAFAFCPKKRGCFEVNHKNGIKADNRACNLDWTNHAGNQQHRRKVLKHGVCRVVNVKTKQQYATTYEAYKETGTPVLAINKSIMFGGDWVWKT